MTQPHPSFASERAISRAISSCHFRPVSDLSRAKTLVPVVLSGSLTHTWASATDQKAGWSTKPLTCDEAERSELDGSEVQPPAPAADSSACLPTF